MKVALLLTGHARDYEASYEGTKKNLLDLYDVDVYISTWNVDNRGRLVPGPNWPAPTPFNVQHLIDLYKPHRIHIEDHDQFYKNRFPNIDITSSTRPDDIFKVNSFAIELGTFWIERLRDQWYMVKKAWEIIDNPEQYDVILRMRFDTYLDGINLDIGKDNLVTPDRKVDGWERGSVCNLMAYGPPKHMEKYCKTGDHLESMYINDNSPIHHSDEILGIYLKKHCGIYPTLDKIPFHWTHNLGYPIY